IAEHQLNLPVRTDHEHGTHRGIRGRCSAFARIACISRQHVIQLGDFELRVADHGVLYSMTLRLLYVRCPLAWLDTGSTLKPIILQFRFANSGCKPAMYPSSVVQTGVKSFGCENKIPQPSPSHSWKRIGP